MTSTGVLRRLILGTLLAGAALASEGCRTWTAREERAARAYNEGNALREAGRIEEALEAYGTALEEDPEFHAAAFNMALVLVESGRSDEALVQLEALRLRDPGNLTIFRTMGWAAWEAGDAEAALEFYQAALDIFEADLGALHGLADIYDSLGRHSEAAEIRGFITERDDSAENRLDFARSAFNAGSIAESLAAYRAVLAENPSDVEALAGAAAAAEEAGEIREALAYRQDAADSGGEGAEVHRFRAARLLLVDIGDYEDGLSALRTALEAGFMEETALDELLADSPETIRPAVRNLITAQRIGHGAGEGSGPSPDTGEDVPRD